MKKVMIGAVSLFGLLFLAGCGAQKSQCAASAKAMPMASSASSVVATVDDDDSDDKNSTEEIKAMAPAKDMAQAINNVRLPAEPVVSKPRQTETFHASQLKGDWRNAVELEAEIDPNMLEF